MCHKTRDHLLATPEAFRALYAQRLPHYRKADLTVDATGKTVEQLAQEICFEFATEPAVVKSFSRSAAVPCRRLNVV